MSENYTPATAEQAIRRAALVTVSVAGRDAKFHVVISEGAAYDLFYDGLALDNSTSEFDVIWYTNTRIAEFHPCDCSTYGHLKIRK